MLDQQSRLFLSIAHPEVLKQLEEYIHKNQTTALPEVGRDRYIEVLSKAGKGMHLDKITEEAHGCTKADATWAANRKRTGTWLNQNISTISKNGVAGPIEKVKLLRGKPVESTYKLTDDALAAYLVTEEEPVEEEANEAETEASALVKPTASKKRTLAAA